MNQNNSHLAFYSNTNQFAPLVEQPFLLPRILLEIHSKIKPQMNWGFDISTTMLASEVISGKQIHELG
jgi:hypothetical protein